MDTDPYGASKILIYTLLMAGFIGLVLLGALIGGYVMRALT